METLMDVMGITFCLARPNMQINKQTIFNVINKAMEVNMAEVLLYFIATGYMVLCSFLRALSGHFKAKYL